MQPEINVWLFDIQTAIDNIEEYMASVPEGFSHYKNNKMLKQAIERNLEIIGEATNRIMKSGLAVTITHARQVINLRNRIIHSYDSIQDDIVYAIVMRHLPLLKVEIEGLMKQGE